MELIEPTLKIVVVLQRNYCCCMKIYAYDSKIPSFRLWGSCLNLCLYMCITTNN